MIEVKNLSFRYKNSKVDAIKNINFSVKKGEIFGFLGPSGAGKSTTQRVLTGLNRGYNGLVTVNGNEIKNIGSKYYEETGVSFEFPNLYTQFTAKENLDFFASFYNKECANIDNLLESVGLLEESGKKVGNYSKGMKMRLNFVRAFINNPKLVFLDEPTSGLDPVNSQLLKNIIKEKRDKGATLFITTHNMQVAAELCDRVAFIVDGEIKIIESPKNLMYRYGKKELEVEFWDSDKIVKKNFNVDTLAESGEFIKIVQSKKIKTMHTKEATLDEVFIEVTGRSLL